MSDGVVDSNVYHSATELAKLARKTAADHSLKSVRLSECIDPFDNAVKLNQTETRSQ
jgi:hypothetical protein